VTLRITQLEARALAIALRPLFRGLQVSNKSFATSNNTRIAYGSSNTPRRPRSRDRAHIRKGSAEVGSDAGDCKALGAITAGVAGVGARLAIAGLSGFEPAVDGRGESSRDESRQGKGEDGADGMHLDVVFWY
jgi:hypothetical protein